MAQTDEKTFESYVETILLNQAGWRAGDVAEWDVERALFPARIFAFLQDTQSKLWKEMRNLHGDGLESLLIDTLAKELDLKGTLYILRHGFKFYGKTFRLGYFKPAHGLNYDVLELFNKNRLTLTPDDSRQGYTIFSRFGERSRGHLPCLQTLLRQDRPSKTSDPAKLEALKHELDQAQVYHWAKRKTKNFPCRRSSRSSVGLFTHWASPSLTAIAPEIRGGRFKKRPHQRSFLPPA